MFLSIPVDFIDGILGEGNLETVITTREEPTNRNDEGGVIIPTNLTLPIESKNSVMSQNKFVTYGIAHEALTMFFNFLKRENDRRKNKKLCYPWYVSFTKNSISFSEEI